MEHRDSEPMKQPLGAVIASRRRQQGDSLEVPSVSRVLHTSASANDVSTVGRVQRLIDSLLSTNTLQGQMDILHTLVVEKGLAWTTPKGTVGQLIKVGNVGERGRGESHGKRSVIVYSR